MRERALRQSVAQRLGHHHVGGDRQHGPGQRPELTAQIAATGHHDAVGEHIKTQTEEPNPAILAGQTEHFRAFVNTRPTRDRRTRHATHQRQWLHMEAFRFPQCTVIARTVNLLAQLVCIQIGPLDPEIIGQTPLLLQQNLGITEPVGPQHALVDRLAVDLVAVDATAHQAHGLQRSGMKLPCRGQATSTGQLERADRVATEDETAIAPTGAVANLLRFQQQHIPLAALDQAQGGGHAGQTATDDAGPRLQPAAGCSRLQCFPGGLVIPADRHRIASLSVGDARWLQPCP